MQGLKEIEWPTVGVALTIYFGWVALTFYHAQLPLWFMVLTGAWLIAWQSSLQHENLHGHPTRWESVNTLLAYPPLALWLPYYVYKTSHLNHHRAEILAHPSKDPESYYWTEKAWDKLSPIGRTLVRLQMTLIGRLTIGPAWNAGRLIALEVTQARVKPRQVFPIWSFHLLACAMILVWIVTICKMNIWFYIFGIVYPGISLSLVRSFAEHRAAQTHGQQTATVENAKIFGLLFLFNNLHVAHHSRPSLAWYRIPAYYTENRGALLSAQYSRVYQGYFEIAHRYFAKSFDNPIHDDSHETSH